MGCKVNSEMNEVGEKGALKENTGLWIGILGNIEAMEKESKL